MPHLPSLINRNDAIGKNGSLDGPDRAARALVSSPAFEKSYRITKNKKSRGRGTFNEGTEPEGTHFQLFNRYDIAVLSPEIKTVLELGPNDVSLKNVIKRFETRNSPSVINVSFNGSTLTFSTRRV